MNDPTLNYIIVGGDNGSNISGGFGDDIMLGGDGVDIIQSFGGLDTFWGGARNCKGQVIR